VEFFAGLVLDGTGVVLQALDMTAQAIIFNLELLHLLLQCALFLLFVHEHRDAVVAKKDAVSHHQRQCADTRGRGFAPPSEGTVA